MDGGEFPKMGEYEYQYDINGVPYGTTIHEMNHNADYLKNKAIDADANSNLYYWMRSALKPFSRIDPNTDKLTKYYSKPILGVGAVGANKYFTSNENRD